MSRSIAILAMCALATLVGITACGDDNSSTVYTDEHPACTDTGSDDGGADEGDVGPLTGTTCPDNNTLTYESFGKMFMQKYCLSCHSPQLTCAQRMGAPADHNFDVELGIIGNVRHIDEDTCAGPKATNMRMPPTGPKPTLAERKQLAQFIACEAKNSGQELQ
jgi:hypothetical protein